MKGWHGIIGGILVGAFTTLLQCAVADSIKNEPAAQGIIVAAYAASVVLLFVGIMTLGKPQKKK
jgi:ABC-type uncharacterized transport system permease subunit